MTAQLPKPGSYVVAVSGGLDSVCLLDMLVNCGVYKLTVAHFDHGIRPDSSQDLEFVANLAGSYHLGFMSAQGHLGPGASEALARKARYEFLLETVSCTGSNALITAHHLDDRMATLIINLVRGTGRKGVCSLKETELIKRPLLGMSKLELSNYAARHELGWREDSTNQEECYLRNYVRIKVLPLLSQADKQKLEKLMDRQELLNQEIDQGLQSLFNADVKGRIRRLTVNNLPYSESKELIAAWLRYNNLASFNRKTIERLTVAAKTKRPGAKLDVLGKTKLIIDKEFLALSTSER